MNTIEEIKKLKSLLDQGAITEEEFQSRKKEILSKNVDDGSHNDGSQNQTAAKTGLIHEPSETDRISPVNVVNAGIRIKKSVKFTVLSILFSFIFVAILVPAIISEIIPAINGRYGFNWDYLVISYSLPISLILSFIYWIKSLSSLQKAGSLFETSSSPTGNQNGLESKPTE